MIAKIINSQEVSKAISKLDKTYSDRFISLDPNGYFLIKLKTDSLEIIVEHYSNEIDTQGVALDPETRQPISCNQTQKRIPMKIYKGKSAKEIGIQLSEGKPPYPISKIDHAFYLGRELQKAEFCLINNLLYVQD